LFEYQREFLEGKAKIKDIDKLNEVLENYQRKTGKI
jgi:hypothetical protein